MTTVTGDIGIGAGLPPTGKSWVNVRPVEIVTTTTGVTMLPYPAQYPTAADGTFSITVDPLPTGFAYEFSFVVDSGRWLSSPRFVTVPASGTIAYKNLPDVIPPDHAGWGTPAWVADVLEKLSTGGGGGGLDAEAVRDVIGAALVAGAGIAIDVNDAANTITVSAGAGGGVDAEAVRDIVGATLVAGTGVTISIDDAGDTVTISSTATKASVGLGNVDNTSDANKPISTATVTALSGKMNAGTTDTLTEGTTKLLLTAAERTKLAGVATGATANASNAVLLDRSNHTGEQSMGTITGLIAALSTILDIAIIVYDNGWAPKPSGKLGLFISTKNPEALTPPTMAVGDIWIQHPAAVA